MNAFAEIIEVRNPDDGTVVGTVPTTTPDGIEHALERSYRASRRRPSPTHERARILREVADRVQSEAEAHAVLIASEGIKTIREARGEVRRAVETLRLSAEEAKRIGGEVLSMDQYPSGEGRFGWWTRVAAGPVIGITPYNDPLNLVAHKAGPAFAVGCPIIVKPHPQTPFSAMRLVEHFHASGADEDSIQVVQGGGDAAMTLATDPRTRIVSFTGGRRAGRLIAQAVGMKQLLMELGGVGMVAVARDADLDRAVDAIATGAFWAAGQNCVRAQRIVADIRIADELGQRLAARASSMNCGAKLDEATDMGPLVNAALADSLKERVRFMKDAGGIILSGGEGEGSRMQPTWVAGLNADNPLLAEELFGPVATIETAEDDTDLLNRLANGPEAIHAALFTQSLGLATSAFQACNAAALLVNDSTDFRIDAMPFGGVGAAGLGREGVADAVDAMTEKKLIILAGVQG